MDSRIMRGIVYNCYSQRIVWTGVWLMIACQGNELYSRNYPSLCIVGEDMHVVCRAADDHTKDPQYSDCITYYKIKRFRMLIY